MRVRILLAAGLLLPLALAGAAFAQQPKVIKDPSEYNAYIAALNLTDPAKKAAAMDDFAQKYPGSVVRIDALEQAMAAWQEAENQAKVESEARRILALDKGNVRALAIVTFLERTQATQGKTELLEPLRAHAAEGLRALPKWPKPDGLSDAEFAALRARLSAIFEGAAGFAALQAKDYVAARAALRKAVALDADNLQAVYQLGIAELQMEPPDATGFWHVAKAMALADAQHGAAAVQAIGAYGKAKYRRYHGSEEGWDAIVAQAATERAPPADLARRVAPAK